MAISDKTRKILWGRSGNRCAMCRRELVIDATAADNESVVGDECHIVSGRKNGPRHDLDFPLDKLDQPENLVLLCRVHHKMVDDQFDTYTVALLSQLKANHEQWVSSSLKEYGHTPPVRVRRIQENIPSHLLRITTGQDLMNLIGGSYAYAFDNEELTTDSEVDLVSGFLQKAQDWGELWQEIESGERVQAAHSMGIQLKELEEAGFWVFGAKETQCLEGGVGAPSTFPVVHLRVLRSENSDILTVGPLEREEGPDVAKEDYER